MRTLALLALALALAGPATAQTADDDVMRYCTNIRDDAREARYALLDERMATARAELAAQRDALVERTAELAEWTRRREAFLALADERLVAIYAAMRADAAAEQLALIEPVVGAAVLVRLKPRQASAVLAAMPTERAAELASIIAAAKDRTGENEGKGA